MAKRLCRRFLPLPHFVALNIQFSNPRRKNYFTLSSPALPICLSLYRIASWRKLWSFTSVLLVYRCMRVIRWEGFSDDGNRLNYNTISFNGASSRPDWQEARSDSCGFCFSGSVESLLSKADWKTKRPRWSRGGASWVRRRATWISEANPVVATWQDRAEKPSLCPFSFSLQPLSRLYISRTASLILMVRSRSPSKVSFSG